MLSPPSGPWRLAVYYVNHAGFAIVGRDGTTVLVDPFLSHTFPWDGGTERQLDPPPFPAQDLAPCAAVAVTHDHGDHFDAETCRAIFQHSPGASLIGPAPVLDRARREDVTAGPLIPGMPGEPVQVGPLTVLPLANRGNEADRPCPRFSYLVADGRGADVFHSGDSHGPSELWRGIVDQPDLALLWPSQIEDTISAIRPREVWLMHWGRFEPGNFLCNVDAPRLAASLRDKFPDPEIFAHPPGSWVTLPLA
ncbi:MAG: MBL fold metallo-hydrolase [Armatimonadota bacterium]|nr:MAG: MBL fold metallo-hydrolase [Armatimonadota bacterium]